MFNFKSLKTKLVTLIGLAIFLSFAATIAIVTTQTNTFAKKQSYLNAEYMAKEYGYSIVNEIDVAMDTARTLSDTLEGMKISNTLDRNTVNTLLKHVLEENPFFLGVWTCWESNAFDGKDKIYSNTAAHDETGRFIPYWSRSNDKLILDPLIDYDIEGAGDYYLLAKKSKEEIILDPFSYEIDGKNVLLTSLVVPIIDNGNFLGAVGVDISLDTFQQIISEITPYETGYASLISNNGTYVGHRSNESIGKDIGATEELIKIKESIKKGESYKTNTVSNIINEKVYEYYTPIYIGETTTPWSFSISIPIKKILEEPNSIRNSTILIGFISLVFILFMIFLIAKGIIKPINKTTEMLKDIAEGEGDLTRRLEVYTSDEIGELATFFNLFVDKIQKLIVDVKENVSHLQDSSSNIALTMEQANQGIEEISIGISSVSNSSENNASIVEETTASIQELSNNSALISNESNEMLSNSNSALISANEGAVNIKEIVDANNSVKEATDEVFDSIQKLKDSSDKVSGIVSIITNISDQTNLLALNAAIEAARAGESGKGFAVVADEVRKLAEESKEAALNITSLINEMEMRADKANTAIIQGQKTVEVSYEKSIIISSHFNNIVDGVKQINKKIHTISTSTNQQLQSTEEITKAMDEVSSGAQENAGSVQQINAVIEEQASSFEEIGASIEELNNMAQELKNQTDKFKV
ncbi:methyl-accepting chemotaxis protein [Oceanirhabdus sp. W0125-5]|uniref:methyl-accepting chemotaxis protein n=1 Tax=Oceanirhabdus sp. W0125-5 TaxID=2999116 RepID=UPI0022F34273|nr:methyl-accepting chemotaxis protein [Oceanirhabdus sp. W0125-5]WBW95628.1 methyl-accepting chemotaxis protein [Oceanirhabdus sp. W0125-5]